MLLNVSCAPSRVSRTQFARGLRLPITNRGQTRRATKLPHAVPDRCDYDHSLNSSRYGYLSGRSVPQQREDAPGSKEEGLKSSASVTWLFAGAQPRHALRDALSRSPSMPGGKAGGWFAAMSVVVVAVKAVHWSIVKRCRECTSCRGYGIQRCNLCGASGAITWTGKWNHVEPCPACVGKRFVNCQTCGGLYHRPIFNHVSRNAGLQASQDQVITTVDVISPLVD